MNYRFFLTVLILCVLTIGTVQASDLMTNYSWSSVIASDDQGAATAAIKAVDELLSTGWQGNEDGSWVQIDYGLGVSHYIDGYNITEGYGVRTYDITKWRIYGSNDNVTHYLLDYRTGQSFTKDVNKSYSITEIANKSNYRFIRIEALASDAASNPIISEMQFYNQGGSPPPVATFSSRNITDVYNTTATGWEGFTPLKMEFTDTSTNTPTSWAYARSNLTHPAWELFNTSQNSVGTFWPGNWTVNLTATNGAGSGISSSLWVNVSQVTTPVASFTSNKTGGQAPLAVLFTDTSINNPLFWNWSVNASDWSSQSWYNYTTSTNLEYTFPSAGIYNVTLSVQNITESPKVSSQTTDIIVNATLQADFVGAPVTSYASTDVSFVDFSTGAGIYSWDWTFGDGGTSTLKNPTHTYSTVGSFDVSLTVHGADGESTKTELGYITMGTAPNPDAASTLSFRQDDNIIRNISYYNRTVMISNALNASWINGTTIFDTDHIRIMNVLANTTVFAENTISSYSINNATGIIMFNVTNVSGFVAGSTPLSFMDIEMLYDRYSPPIDTVAAWGTGELGNATFKVKFPVVNLVDTPLEYSWTTYSDFIANNTAPVVAEQPVIFIPELNMTADRYLWDFGDGNTFLSYNGSVEHMYMDAVGDIDGYGSYTVTLTAYRSENSSVTNTTVMTDYVSPVYNASYVKADFSGDPTSGSVGLNVMFTDLSKWGTTDAVSGRTYNWSFGDDLYSISPYSDVKGDVSHVYAALGTYTVKLEVNNTITGDSETKINYITISNNQQSTWYVPVQMRLSTVRSDNGAPIGGVMIRATPLNFTAPKEWAQILIGIQPNVNIDGTTVYGYSGTDGSWTAPVLQSYLYQFTFVNASENINQVSQFYPSDPQYRILINTESAANYTYSDISGTNLTFTQPNASYITLGMNYQDASTLTQNVTFSVEDWKNGTVFYSQTFTTGFVTSSVSSSYTMPNVRGDEFVWKYVAYRSDGTVITQGNGGTSKGPSGVGVDLGLPLDWYRWISISVLFMLGSMSSQRTKQYWAVLIPIFAAIFFWWGWFTGESNLWGLIVLCAVFGVVIYMKASLREKHGVGGPGALLINIVAFLIIVQACIGFVNGLQIWGDAIQVAVSSPYHNVDIATNIPIITESGGILTDIIAASTIIFDLWFSLLKALWVVLSSIAVIYPTLVYMFPFVASSPQLTAYLALLQIGIWLIYLMFAYKFARGELGTVEL